MAQLQPGDVIELDVDGQSVTAEVMTVTEKFAVLHSVEQGTAAVVPWDQLENARIFQPE